MKVGLVVYGSLDSPSGGYRYDRELVRRLESRGATVVVFSQRWHAYPFRLAASLNIAFRRRVERAELDVLLEDELNHPSLLSMTRSRRLPPRIAIVHHLRISERHSDLAKTVYRPVERQYLDQVDAFICNSETTAGIVRRTSPRRRPLVVAKPGGRSVVHAPTPGEVVERGGERPLRILFVGQLTRRKGLHTLLEALAELPAGSWRLDVAGDSDADPTYAKRCRARAAVFSGAVRFLGHLNGSELEQAYREAHVLCVPSQYEGYGIVYSEAMQYGLPAIATRGGAAHEIVDHGRTGFVVPVESPGEVAAALDELRDPATLQSFSLRALERARTLPTWRASMDVAVDFVEEVVRIDRQQGDVSV